MRLMTRGEETRRKMRPEQLGFGWVVIAADQLSRLSFRHSSISEELPLLLEKGQPWNFYA